MDGEAIVSPWSLPFAELIPLMTAIGNGIYKKIVKRPVDDVEIKGKCSVTCHYNAYFEKAQCAFDSTTLSDRPKKFITSNGEVSPGFEYAVMSMKRGEESQFFIPYTMYYGELGCGPRIPPKADALFVIQLINFSEMGDEEATENVSKEDRRKYGVMIDKILEVKKSANHYYNQGSYIKAAGAYHKAIDELQKCNLADVKEEEEQHKHLVTLHQNVMMCYNKIDKPAKACSAFNDMKHYIKPNASPNVKALYEYGKALFKLDEYARSIEVLKKANAMKPNDSLIIQLLKDVEKKFSSHKSNEKKMFRAMFGNMTIEDEKTICDLNENFKTTVKDVCTTLRNDPNASRKYINTPLNEKEKDYIREVVKEFGMTFVEPIPLQGPNASPFIAKTLT